MTEPVSPNPPSTKWDRFLFVLSKAPRIWDILQELYHIAFEGREGDLSLYLDDLHETIKMRKAAKTEEDRRNASRRFSDLISRL